MNKIKRRFSFLILAALLASISVADAASVERSNSLGQNLLTYSEQFDNAVWTKSYISVSANTTETTDPVGGHTADKVSETAAIGVHQTYQAPTTNGFGTYTYSIYLKNNTRQYVVVYVGKTPNPAEMTIDLTNGTITNTSGSGYISSRVVPVGDGWYRASITVNFNSGLFDNVQLMLNSSSGVFDSHLGDITKSIYVWGAQLVLGSRATAYNRTAASALNTAFVPTGSTRSNQLGQNIWTYSEQIDNAAWSKTSVTVTANAVQAPDGTMTADKITDSSDGVATSHFFNRNITGTADGQLRTISIYAKKGTKNFIDLSPDGASVQQSFNLSDCTKASLLNNSLSAFRAAGVIDEGNGWCRVWVTWKRSGGVEDARIWIVNDGTNIQYTGDGTGTIFVWGAQVVIGDKPAAYNRTIASALNTSFTPAGSKRSNQLGQNLITYSEQFDNAAWTKLNTTVTANAATAPNGKPLAEMVTDDATSGQHAVYRSDTDILSGRVATLSVYAKQGTGRWILIAGNGGNAGQYFDLQNGVKGSIVGANFVSSEILAQPNGWYRLSVTYRSTSFWSVFYMASADGVISYSGTGSTIYLWGAQQNFGNKTEAYNKTEGSVLNSSYVP